MKIFIAALIACTSLTSLAQTCENERQRVISATNGRNPGDTAGLVPYIQNEVRDGGDFRVWCYKITPKCDTSKLQGITPSSATYKDVLNLWADIQRSKATEERDPKYGEMRIAQYFWFECVARRMAADARPRRAHQE